MQGYAAVNAALVKAQPLLRVPLQAFTRGNGPVPSLVGALESTILECGVRLLGHQLPVPAAQAAPDQSLKVLDLLAEPLFC